MRENLPPRTRGLNPYRLDRNMQRFLKRAAPDMLARQDARLEGLGAFAGGRLDAQAEASDRHFPARLEMVFDHPTAPQGRTGRVVLNPEYEACQQEVYKMGFMAPCFDKAALESPLLPFVFQYYLSYADIATGCPPAMTHPIALLLATAAPQALRDKYLPEMLRTDGFTPVGGTWATERHSGSDVGASVTSAKKQPDGSVTLHGHNWFTSAIGFNRYLTIKTARPEGAVAGGAGLGLYLVPSHIDEKWSVPNKIQITHLKDKMGTKGLPTGEVTLDGTVAHEIAPAGQGLRVMMLALGCSRVHNAMAAAGVMYRCYMEALCWAENRKTFGKKLIDRPMVKDDILTLVTNWMAGSAMAFEAARSFAHMQDNPQDKKAEAWCRMVTALAKFRTAEDAVRSAKTALEIVGGNGYARDHAMERVYRDAMVLTVWEGPRHIQALEVVRMLGRGDGGPAFMDGLQKRMIHWPKELHSLKHRIAPLYAHLIVDLGKLSKNPGLAEESAGRLMERMADLCAVVLLADEAAWELKHENDTAKIAVAEHLFGSLFEKHMPVRLDESPLRAHFEAIVRDRAVAPPAAQKSGDKGPDKKASGGPRP
jgi:acyl-CoA dehydrogenase